MATIAVHLGAHKSGSKFIQIALRRVRERSGGIVALTDHKTCPEMAPFRAPFVSLNKGQVPDRKAISRARDMLSRLSEKADTITVSDETLLGRHGHMNESRLYPRARQAAQLLAEITRDHELKTLLIVRFQPDLVESWYMQTINEGREIEIDDFLEKIPIYNLYWAHVLEDIREFTPSVGVLPFENVTRDPRRFLVDVFSYLHVDPRLAGQAPVEQVNSSLSLVGLQIAKRSFPLLNIEDRMDLRRFLQSRFPNTKYGRAKILPEDVRASLAKHYSKDYQTVIS